MAGIRMSRWTVGGRGVPPRSSPSDLSRLQAPIARVCGTPNPAQRVLRADERAKPVGSSVRKSSRQCGRQMHPGCNAASHSDAQRVDARRWVPRDAEESLLLNLGRRFSSDAVRAHVRTHRISYVCIPNPSTPWTTNAASQPASPSRCAMQRDSMRAFKPEPVTALGDNNIQRTPALPPPYPRFATLRAGRDASSAM